MVATRQRCVFQGPDTNMPGHPANSNADAREFAEKIFSHLQSHPEGASIDTLIKFRPKHAEKIGKLLQKYPTWFKRERVKADKGAYPVDTLPSGSSEFVFRSRDTTALTVGFKDTVKLADGV